MKKSIWRKVLLIACTIIATLSMLTQNVFAAEIDEQAIPRPPGAVTPLASDDDDDDGILDAIFDILDGIKSLPQKIAEVMIDAIMEVVDMLTTAVMDGITAWLISAALSSAATVFTDITSSTVNIFNYDWFKVIVRLFRYFGTSLFAVGVLLAFVDVCVEYRRRGADIGGAMLNLGKGLMAVGLFSTVPVPLYKFCVNIQSVILRALSIDWSFQSVTDALLANYSMGLLMLIMLIVIIVLMIIIYVDSLKRGGILLVQICIGSLYMISVPRGYMDNFYGWCKQIIALCITTLFQNLLMFCGLMIIPTNLFLGIGTMFAAKEVPRICGQFGLDTSVKASFTGMAMGANASVQAIKAAMTILA